MQAEKTDYLIIGAGIIGLTLAMQLRKKMPGKKILLLEKEADVAAHSSGRNSGRSSRLRGGPGACGGQ